MVLASNSMAQGDSLWLEDSKNPLPAPLLNFEEVDIDLSDVVAIGSVLYRDKVLFDTEVEACYHA